MIDKNLPIGTIVVALNEFVRCKIISEWRGVEGYNVEVLTKEGLVEYFGTLWNIREYNVEDTEALKKYNHLKGIYGKHD